MATPVTGLVIEKMRKIESRAIGRPLSISWTPATSTNAILPWRASSATTPASSPSSTIACSPTSSRSRRSAESPTSAGSTVSRTAAAVAPLPRSATSGCVENVAASSTRAAMAAANGAKRQSPAVGTGYLLRGDLRVSTDSNGIARRHRMSGFARPGVNAGAVRNAVAAPSDCRR